MYTPDEQNQRPVEIIELPVQMIAPGSRSAKLSIIAAVVVILLNLAGETVFSGRQGVLSLVAVVSIIVIGTGLAGAVAALISAFSYHVKNPMVLAFTGLLLNGALLAGGFIKAPVLGRGAGMNIPTVKQAEARPVFTQSGRKVVTQDWTAGSVIVLADYNFDSVIENTNGLVLVDFFAPWCKPCRAMAPIIEEIASDYAGRVKVYKLDIDDAPNTASKFNITGIPTIILFQNGNINKRWLGFTDKQSICSGLDRAL